MSEREFEDFLRRKAEGFSLTPREDSFDRIMAGLETEKKKRRLAWVWWTTPVLGIAIVAGILWFNPADSGNANMVAQSNPTATELQSAKSSDLSVHTDVATNQTGAAKSNNAEQETMHPQVKTNTSSQITNSGVAPVQRENGTQKHSEKTDVVQRQSQRNTSSAGNISNTQLADVQGVTSQNVQTALETQATDSHISDELLTRMEAPQQANLKVLPVVMVSNQATIRPGVTLATTATRVVNSGWFIGAQFTAMASSQDITRNPEYAELTTPPNGFNADKYLNKRRMENDFRFGFNTGVFARYQAPKGWFVQTGINYQSHTFNEEFWSLLSNTSVSTTISNDTLVFTDYTGNDTSVVVSTTETALVFGYDTLRYENQHRVSSIEIPVWGGYSFQKGKWNFDFMAGAALQIFTHSRSYIYNGNGGVPADLGDSSATFHRSFGASVMGGFQVGYAIAPRWSIYGGPNFRYNVTSLFKSDYALRQRPFHVGFEVGVKFRIK